MKLLRLIRDCGFAALVAVGFGVLVGAFVGALVVTALFVARIL